jgi:hypothetical protein
MQWFESGCRLVHIEFYVSLDEPQQFEHVSYLQLRSQVVRWVAQLRDNTE